MPVDRLFHPSAGHSKKVNQLTHLEFRVWWTYQMAADDWGVMRKTPIAVQAANDSLVTESADAIRAALNRIVRLGLLTEFTHQGDEYVCQLTWQNFQHVRYPRESLEPMPPPDVLAQCTPETQALFQERLHRKQKAGKALTDSELTAFRKFSGKVAEIFPKHFSKSSSRARANGYGNGSRQTANGSEEREREREKPAAEVSPSVAMGFTSFWREYPWQTDREAAWLVWQRLAPDDALVTEILAAVAAQKTWPPWQQDHGRYIPKPANWLTRRGWEDQRVGIIPEVSPDLTLRYSKPTIRMMHALATIRAQGRSDDS
jgi:hypothetical protein